MLNGVESKYNVNHCMITHLFVPASKRHQGLGSAELKRIEDILKKNNCKWSHVFVGPLEHGSPPASEFYRKRGYFHRHPNMINLLSQMFGIPNKGSPQGGFMFKQI